MNYDPQPIPRVAALGHFDGLHAGHMTLIGRVGKEAAESGFSPAAWFPEGLAASRFGEGAHALLTTPAEKKELLRSAGVHDVLTDRFSSVRDLSPSDFVRRVLIEKYGVQIAVCGFNFRFGKGASGDADLLVRLMEECGGKGIVLPPFEIGGMTVSSSAIRRLLETGDPSGAASMLGRPYSIRGIVVHGNRLGKTLGFPTANLRFPGEKIIPRRGVYAVKARTGGQDILRGMANVGSRPTVAPGRDEVNCETHLFDFRGDLYGKEIEISFLEYLRPENKFGSLADLSKAMEKDRAAALRYFDRTPAG